jgi:hydrogenase 3 maturation protease
MNFKESLDKALDGAKKVVVVGIGNELNGDDGFGVHAAKKLGNSGKLISIQAHTVPENFITKIAAEKPSHVIFLDAAILDAAPGTLCLLETGDLARVATITHRIPLSKIIERLVSIHNCSVFIIGLQPKSMEVGSDLSPDVQAAVDKLVGIFNKSLSL